MPAANYTYDPRMALPANKITGETMSVNMATDISVFPVHGPFFREGFTLEGFSAGAWTTLNPNIDYLYSPVFMGAAAATGREIFSYVLLIKNVSQVRYSYHVLGQYTDEKLLAEIAASSINRAKLFEWQRIKGSAITWGTQTRDSRLVGSTLTEILVEQLTGIKNAIGNPYDGGVNYGPKITELEAALSSIPGIDDLGDLRDTPDAAVVVTANNGRELVMLSAPRYSLTAIVSFVSSDGTDVETVFINAVTSNNTPRISPYGRTGSRNEPILTFSIQPVTGNTRISATARYAGTISIKILTQF